MAHEDLMRSMMNFSNGEIHPTKVLMPRIGYTILAIIMAIFCTVSIILNTSVIVVTIKYRQLRHPLNYSLVNLAVADLGVTVLGGLLTVETNAVGYFNLGRIGCVIEGFAVAFFGIAALCTIAVIAVDRVFVVCRPMGTLMFTTKHAAAGIAASWVWSLVWNTPPLFGWGSYELEGVETSCAPNWYSTEPSNMSYIICYFCFCFAIPFFIIVVSYGYLMWTLRQVAKLVPMYLTKTSTVYNPIIYIFMNKQFQECMIPFLFCGRNPWAVEPSVSSMETSVSVSTSSASGRGKVSPA
ncbi:parapinopsin-like [Rhinophrynus dorsalis]